MKKSLAVLFAVAIAAVLLPLSSKADIPLTRYGPTTFTAAGNMPVINLAGQSSCSMTLSGTGSATITPKASNNSGTTYDTLSALGAQTANGTYGGYISPYLTNFYVAVTGVTGTVAVSEACSAAAPAAQPAGPYITPAPGSSGYVALYPSAQPSGQNGSAYLGGGYFAFPASASPSPVVGSTGPVGFYVNTTGGGFITNNYDDGIGQTHNALTIAYNNQGNQENIITFSRSGNISVNGGKYTATAIATPPAPVPTCTPGGSNSSTQYWVKINYVNNTGKSTSSPESTVTCASGTLLQVPLSVTNYTTSKFWTVSATTAGTGQEKEQTQGTSPSSGTNIPLSTTIWTSTATLAGSTAASSSDSSLDCWGDSTLLVMALCPEGQSLLSNPLKVASLSNGSTTASFVAPVYTNAGSAVGSTYHGSQFTCTFSASTTCVLGASYWTGSSVFSSSSSIDGCSLKHSAASTVTFGFEQTGTATGTVTASASNSETVTGVCWGT